MNFINKLKRIFYILALVTGFVVLSIASNFIYNKYIEPQALSVGDVTDLGSDEQTDCNVLGINLHGQILTYIPVGAGDSFMDENDLVSNLLKNTL